LGGFCRGAAAAPASVLVGQGWLAWILVFFAPLSFFQKKVERFFHMRAGPLLFSLYFLQRRSEMDMPCDVDLLRVFVGEQQKHGGRPVYEAIVEAARERGLMGATVLRGIMGFGSHCKLHTAKVLMLSEDLPMVVEIVDTAERIRDFLPVIKEMNHKGLITLEKIQVVANNRGQGEEKK